jgi:parallel beta-helix repeat protein
MHKKLWLVVLVGALLWNAAPAMADGDIYVIAGGGAAGTRIASLPYTISNAGFYYVASNLTYTGTLDAGITVSADDVTIDLMGFRLSNDGTKTAIYNSNQYKNLEIRNGTLSGWYNGIHSYDSNNNRFINMRIEGSTQLGIYLNGYGHLIKGCTISNTSDTGIWLVGGGTISNNVVNNNTFYGIVAGGYSMISNNLVSNSAQHIYLSSPGTIIGNTIRGDSGQTQTGINLTDAGTTNPILVDQNTVAGCSTPISYTAGMVVITKNNAGITSTP